MRKVLIILLSIVTFNALGQKMPKDYFIEGDEYLKEDSLVKSLECYSYIIQNNPRNPLYPKAFFNVGFLHYKLEMNEESKAIFKQILSFEVDDRELIGGDIMSNPYANYKNRSCQILYEIYNKTEQYDSALYYFKLADTKYPYQSFCGNAHASNRVYKALVYADLYQKKEMFLKQEEALLRAIFVDGLTGNNEVIEQLKLMYQKKDNPIEIKKEFDKALKKMKRIVIKNEDKEPYYQTYFKFHKIKLYIPYHMIGYENYTVKKVDLSLIKKEIYELNFYKMLEEL